MDKFTTLEIDNINDCLLNHDSKVSWSEKFEKKFSRYIGCKYSISCNSGTSGLHAALYAAQVGKGDEVIMPALTVVMDAYAIIHLGAKPIFVDVDLKTHLIDPEDLIKKITNKTKAIITVSWEGLMCEMDKINKIAKEKNILVIDDSARTVDGYFKKTIAGKAADLTVFSFESKKHLTCGGEGGMITTDNEELAVRARKFAGIGYKGLVADAGRTSLSSEVYQDPSYERFDTIGFNYRMNAITAACGLAQLNILDELVDLRQRIGKRFLSAIKNCSWLIPQRVAPNLTHTYFTFGVIYEGESQRNIKWKEFYKMYKENDGDGFYACWKNPYLEPSLKSKEYGTQIWEEGLCPKAEKIQKKIMAFKTNYRDYEIAEYKISILEKLIDKIGR